MKKKSLFLIAALLLVLCLPNVSVINASASASASINFEDIPPKGDSSAFITGSVTLPGGAVNYSDYRITAYLRIPGNATWWGPKPTFAEPTVTINSNGRFTLRFATGGSDTEAVEIRVFLIRAGSDTDYSHLSGSGAAASALIGRSDGGIITVDGVPWVAAVEDYTAFDAMFPGVRKDVQNALRFSINYSPYTGTFTPMRGLAPSESHIRRHLEQLAEDFDSVRFFTAEDGLLVMYDIAHELGLKVIGTAWIDRWMPEAQIYGQLDNLIKLANDGKIMIASVGSEVLFRNDKTPAELLTYINYVKERITAPVPVTYMDVSGAFNGAMNLSGLDELNAAADLILFSHYPIFSNNYLNQTLIANHGGVMEYAIAELNNAYNEIKSRQGLGKPAILAETGWSTAGTFWLGSAQPSMENSRAYWDAVHEWARENNTDVFWFNSFDENWKPLEGGFDARHWGVFYSDGQVKEAFADLFTEIPAVSSFTTADALIILRYAAGMIDLTPEQIKLYDFGGKGSVNTNDALAVLRIVAGI
jgi:exo-beta-1,3-glucanase (GH17 family)